MSLLSLPVLHPSDPPPSDNTSPRKRSGDDENDFQAPKKKRLMGRSLVAGLQEIPNNVVSNTLPRTVSSPPVKALCAAEQKIQQHVSLPIPPAEQIEPTSYASIPDPACGYTRSTNGKTIPIASRPPLQRVSYEQLIAQRSDAAAAGKAQQSFYGINIHKLIEESDRAPTHSPIVTKPTPVLVPSIEDGKSKKRTGLLWTEKYRAKKFTDLVGDERTHRNVLRWLKAWDPIVFPGAGKSKMKAKPGPDGQEEHHRKILMLTGSPGLGKTTLAHVCAKQAGYEVVEVNASDERSSSVVKNKIRDCVGIENVRGVSIKSATGAASRRPGKPVCVIIDEVDGVTTGNGAGGEGGFVKALIDLVQLDQKNSRGGESGMSKGKKGDKFRMLRPMILICNDVYHASLRPLRSSGLAEIVHVRKAPLDKVIERVKHVFDREGVACDQDAVRRLCEHTWGVTNRKDGKSGATAGDGDMRSVLVVGEWAAAKLRATSKTDKLRLTKPWIEAHIASGPTNEGGRGLGRGGAKEAAERIFMENAGFPKGKKHNAPNTPQFVVPGSTSKSATDVARGEAIQLLRQVVETTGEHDRIVTDAFSAYPTHPFQDDTFLTKPNAAYDWLHFHDSVSSRVYSEQDWELIPYQSTTALGFHYLFGSGAKQAPKQDSSITQGQEEEEVHITLFTGPRADWEAREAGKETIAVLQGLRSTLNIDLRRMFRSPEEMAVDLLPHLIRMLTPDVKPVVVGGKGESMASVRRESEKDMVRRAVEAMGAVGVSLTRCRVEDQRMGSGGWIYRMEPALDSIAAFETLDKTAGSGSSARYAVRQIMDQEHRKFVLRRAAEARRARFQAGADEDEPDSVGSIVAVASHLPLAPSTVAPTKVKKDFFGRVIKPTMDSAGEEKRPASGSGTNKGHVKVWCTFNEGFSNAVRKPITLKELMDGL